MRPSTARYLRDVQIGSGIKVIRFTEEESTFRRRKTKPETKYGKVCPACGLNRSLAGKCDCNS